MLDEFTGHVLKPLCKMGSCRTFVWLDVSRDDVDTSPLGGVGGLTGAALRLLRLGFEVSAICPRTP